MNKHNNPFLLLIQFFLGGLFFVCFAIDEVMAQQPAFARDRQENVAKIDSLALEKIRDLSKYISIIGDKKTPFSEADMVVERALELFADGAQIGVSNIQEEEVQYFGLRDYFERLMALNYDQVMIEWYDMQYISDIERMPNGVYVGVVTIYQRFQGKQGDNIVYKDVTKKDITVYVEKKETQVEGDVINFWDVVLGDIMVAETKQD